MANTPSAKKRVRQLIRKSEVNKARRSRVKTYVKKVEEAVSGGNSDLALQAFKAAQPEIQRSVSKGIMHKNTASRKISRLSNRVKRLSS